MIKFFGLQLALRLSNAVKPFDWTRIGKKDIVYDK